jgi:hypothetical protein
MRVTVGRGKHRVSVEIGNPASQSKEVQLANANELWRLLNKS